MFTCNGDGTGIGDGERMCWDASITDEGYWLTHEDDADIPEGMKRHSVTISFRDSIWIKEGTIYYMNAMKNSYVDMFVLCPPTGVFMYLNQLYVNMTGNYLVVDHYLNRHPIQGSVPIGDELNTETCSQELPSFLSFRLSATVPIEDVSSYGYMEMEIYRNRTVDLDDLINVSIIPYTP
jgi:hypothetical protein